MRDIATCGLATTSLNDPLEQVSVLTELNRLDTGPDQGAAVLLQDPCRMQGDGRIERGLAAKGRQNSVGSLLGDDRLDNLGGDRLDIGRIRELGVGHDGGRVRVDQDDP